MSPPRTTLLARGPGRSRGLSLVELMVAMVIGLVLSGAVVLIYNNNKHAYRAQNNMSQLQENGRYALKLLREDIRMAGYWGLSHPNARDGIASESGVSLSNECAAGWATDVGSPVHAVNNANTGYTACIPSADYKANTDILTVRHASSEPIADGDIAKDGLYVLTSVLGAMAFKADADDKVDTAVSTGTTFASTPTTLHQVVARAYYIRPWSQTAGDGIPTLVRETIAGSAVTAEPLIEYVEDLQITFGLDTNGDGSVDQYDDNGIDAGSIPSVATIVVEVLVRAPSEESRYTNTRSYQLGDRVHAANDGYRRQVFRDSIYVRNWAGLSS